MFLALASAFRCVGCALERVISRRDLLLEMERALGELDEAAAHAFIDECDALHGLALTASE